MLARETAVPMAGLILASGASIGLVAARILWTGNTRYGFLIWNLFLAWLPLVFAILARFYLREKGEGRNRGFLACAGAWLLFFPNAPYIFTDIVHLTGRFPGNFWVDLSLILMCAMTGLLLGFVSLFLMQTVVVRRCGRLAGWGFIGAVTGLSAFGVYLGRFLRFNSWDVVTNPAGLLRGIAGWASDPLAHSTSWVFPVLFAMFLFVAYVMVYALTHLPRVEGRLLGEAS